MRQSEWLNTLVLGQTRLFSGLGFQVMLIPACVPHLPQNFAFPESSALHVLYILLIRIPSSVFDTSYYTLGG